MSCPEYTTQARQLLLRVARNAIELGMDRAAAADVGSLVGAGEWRPQLSAPRATFVTLRKFEALRGCTGSLEPTRPLVEDVAVNACHTAFNDPRFPPLERDELIDVRIEISVLSPLREMSFADEQDLLGQLDPSMGLVLELGSRRGTFLPKVWESLPDPAQFLLELKHKAGIPGRYWSSEIRVMRYHTETFADPGELTLAP